LANWVLLVFSSCYSDIDKKEGSSCKNVKIKSNELVVSYADSTTLKDNLEILRLGTIDIIQDVAIRKIISDAMSKDYYQVRISY
jgi:hypothetical protein